MTNDEPTAIRLAIAANIRAERARASLSQQDVADAMRQRGFAYWRQQTTGATERGERRVTADELVALAAVLGIAPEALWRVALCR
jgi:transcriptional regulator with XRE-family HTH domain